MNEDEWYKPDWCTLEVENIYACWYLFIGEAIDKEKHCSDCKFYEKNQKGKEDEKDK